MRKTTKEYDEAPFEALVTRSGEIAASKEIPRRFDTVKNYISGDPVQTFEECQWEKRNGKWFRLRVPVRPFDPYHPYQYWGNRGDEGMENIKRPKGWLFVDPTDWKQEVLDQAKDMSTVTIED